MGERDDTLPLRPRVHQKLRIADILTLPDLLGTVVLGRYHLSAVLGEGAMGRVYHGVDRRLARPVAIKVLRDDLVHDQDMRKRFRREAQAAGRLGHRNVAAVLDVGETPDAHPVMVMELALGTSLRERMAGGPFARARIVPIVRALLAGLDHAHAAGLIHRDLKPENVIVEDTAAGEVPRIVDFGIAILKDPDEKFDNGRITASGQICGTPAYMAPEQAKGEVIDHRVDLFALGVIVYELVAGVQPFTGSPLEVAVFNTTHDPPAIATRARHALGDALLERFARKLMARDAGARFASAAAALAALDHDLVVDPVSLPELPSGSPGKRR